MKKLTLFVAVCSLFAAVVLLAADPWQSKPFAEWSDKDVQKILTNSPWARPVSVSGAAGGGPSLDNGRPSRSDAGNPNTVNADTGPAGVAIPGAQGGGSR